MAFPDATERSRRRWDEFAERDPLYYIATNRRRWDEDAFIASGRSIVNVVMTWLDPGGPRERMLEIGCGVGRTAVHFARVFGHVDGVDVSPSMIDRARRRGLPPNVALSVGSGRDLAPFETAAYHLVYSALVFQHIPDRAVIASYLSEIARVLADEGRAVLQFDTRRETTAGRLYKALPDALLPRAHRRFIRRYRRDATDVRDLARDGGLAVLDERGAGTAEHYFLLRREGGGSP